MEKETEIISWEQVFFVHHRILSAVKTVEFVSDRMSYSSEMSHLVPFHTLYCKQSLLTL